MHYKPPPASQGLNEYLSSSLLTDLQCQFYQGIVHAISWCTLHHHQKKQFCEDYLDYDNSICLPGIIKYPHLDHCAANSKQNENFLVSDVNLAHVFYQNATEDEERNVNVHETGMSGYIRDSYAIESTEDWDVEENAEHFRLDTSTLPRQPLQVGPNIEDFFSRCSNMYFCTNLENVTN